MPVVKTKDLQEGDRLAQNIYRENTLILKAGIALTKAMISKLRQMDVPTAVIMGDEDDEAPDGAPDQSEPTTSAGCTAAPADKRTAGLREKFWENLFETGHEYRYGLALNEEKDTAWLESLFIKFMSDSTIYRLMEKLRKWDHYAYQHSFDVFVLGALFAKRLRLNDIEDFALGCLLHDIGKMNIPQSLLNKPGKLTDREYLLMKQHTIYGYELLKQHDFGEGIALLARSHHERIDGSGYPDGLRGNELPEHVKILSIVDVYSATTLRRPYREPYGSSFAERIMMHECKRVNDDYFCRFFQMLNIFPEDIIVELSEGTLAKIVHVNDKVPTRPSLQDIHQSKPIDIPLAQRVQIKQVIKL